MTRDTETIVLGNYCPRCLSNPCTCNPIQTIEATKVDIVDKRELAHKLIDAYFDKKEILVKDVKHGIDHWVSIYDPNYWTYIQKFCDNIKCYKIFEE